MLLLLLPFQAHKQEGNYHKYPDYDSDSSNYRTEGKPHPAPPPQTQHRTYNADGFYDKNGYYRHADPSDKYDRSKDGYNAGACKQS